MSYRRDGRLQVGHPVRVHEVVSTSGINQPFGGLGGPGPPGFFLVAGAAVLDQKDVSAQPRFEPNWVLSLGQGISPLCVKLSQHWSRWVMAASRLLVKGMLR